MRRVAVLVTAAVTVLVIAAVAIAQTTQTNQYKVTASVAPSKKGSAKKPTPVKETVTFNISESHGNNPSAVKSYTFDVYGVRSNGKFFPTCSAAAMRKAGSDAKCAAGSRVGSGTITSVVYQSNDPSSKPITCAKSVRIYNSGQNVAVLYIYGPGSQCAGISQPFIFPAKFVKASKGGGQKFTFSVPQNVLHSVPGLTTAVLSSTSSFSRVTKTVKGTKRGYLESVGCLGSQRPVKVVFTAENGQTASASTKAVCTK